MFPFCLDIELSHLHELLMTSFVAVTSTVSWFWLGGRA